MASRKSSLPVNNTYGITDGLETWGQFHYDCAAFARKLGPESGCPPRPELFRKISDSMMPRHFEWHGWTQRIVDSACRIPVICYAGCSNSSKTYNVMGFAFQWWACNPWESSVTLVSTSMKSLRARGWAEISRIYSNLGSERFGNFIDSQMIWQATAKGVDIVRDDKHAIRAKAVEEGPIQKVADDIKGVHTRRQMVIIDEATSVPKAIYEACTNLYSYPEEFILILIGNPPQSKLNQFSQFCEPKEGWLSVDVDSEEWEGKPIAELGNLKPFIVRFDAEKSPNITEGKVVSKHLPTKEKVEAARHAGGGQTPAFWSNFRGFWPPEGMSKTVFSESALLLNDGCGKLTFTGDNFFVIGAFDPAFGGGDRATLRFAKLGMTTAGKWGIQLYAPIIIPIDARSKNPVHFQLAEQVRRECENVKMEGMRYHCSPDCLAVDATGEGGGLCDIIQRTWSFDIIRVEFAGKASEEPINLEDNRLACDVYENKAVEMWFRARDALNSGQLKGIDADTAVELTNRKFYDDGKRIQLQSKTRDRSQQKKSYKSEFGKSPDLADSAVILLEVARKKGFRLAPVGQTVTRHESFEKVIKRSQAVFLDTYAEEEIEMEMSI